jgi:hypothetical protein
MVALWWSALAMVIYSEALSGAEAYWCCPDYMLSLLARVCAGVADS